MALLLSVGICCYLLELCSHKSSIIKHDLLLVFIDICWNYFFTVVICCYMLLYVAIYWNYFIIAIQTSMANRKMDLNPIRARSLLEDTFLEIEISKSLWFSLRRSSLNKSVLEFCIMGSRLTENSEVAQNFSFLIRYELNSTVLIFWMLEYVAICCYLL